MSTDSKVYTFKVLLRQLADLQKIEKRTGATVAEQIRRGIDLWIKQNGRTA
jgi:hypothetical protein